MLVFSVKSPAQQAHSEEPAVLLERNARDNTPKTIRFSETAHIRTEETPGMLRSYFQLEPTVDELRPERSTRTKNGATIDGYGQWYKGYKVEHGMVTVISYDGVVRAVNADFYQTAVPPATDIKTDEHTALQKALAYVGAEKYIWEESRTEILMRLKQDTSLYPHASIVWIEDYSSGSPDGKLHLSYRFDIYALQPLSRQLVYVDAVTGKVLFSNSLLQHVKGSGNTLYSGSVSFETVASGNKYVLHDMTRGGGIFTYFYAPFFSSPAEITNSTISWPGDTAIDAHWAISRVYDYWDNVQHRKSYNNHDSALVAYVHYGNKYDNAFWDGSSMSFGDGSGKNNGGFDPMVSLDICAHEMGHGICQTTCGLIYSRESGAMNEGFSDIWGAVVENWADPHENDGSPKLTWEVGEEVSLTPLRSMSDPKRCGDPDTYKGEYWVYADSGCNTLNDVCGVHTNSGVLNHWFYLLSQGGSGTNDIGHTFHVSGVGINKAADIAYNTELALTPASAFADCRSASISVAEMLYGKCSAEAEAVIRAWYAVGIGNDFVPCTPHISFAADTVLVNEYAQGTSCRSGKKVYVPLVLSGPVIAGGTANITITARPSQGLKEGVDFTLDTAAISFPAGSTGTANVVLTLYDNGAVNDDSYVDLEYKLAPGSSNLESSTYRTCRLMIQNDDHAPGGITQSVCTYGLFNRDVKYASPFILEDAAIHMQYIYRPAELIAAGVKPGLPVMAIGFMMVHKYSTQPFKDFTVKMANVPVTELSNGYLTSGFTQLYNGNYNTVPDWNMIPFSNTFSWDGASSLAMDICFTHPTYNSMYFNDEIFEYMDGGTDSCTLMSLASLDSTGCDLRHVYYATSARPAIRFIQATPGAAADTVLDDSRTWNIQSGQEVYFYESRDSTLIAGVKQSAKDLGCTTATITAAGKGMQRIAAGALANADRTIKELALSSDASGRTGRDVTVYYAPDELGGANPDSLHLVCTPAFADSNINSANTEVVKPIAEHINNFYGFTGHFTGGLQHARYFLTDKTLDSAPGMNACGMSIVNTIFDRQIWFHYGVSDDRMITVQLFDVAGRVCYKGSYLLQAGNDRFLIDMGSNNLPPGVYILRIHSSECSCTYKVFRK
ncbi:M4 family metallopeptidase [Chitinophagaceae bacterium MMS25-I14]